MQKGLGFSVKNTSKVIGKISLVNFEVIFTKTINFKNKNNMICAVPTLRKVIFGWHKAAEKRLHENKNSQEMLISVVGTDGSCY